MVEITYFGTMVFAKKPGRLTSRQIESTELQLKEN